MRIKLLVIIGKEDKEEHADKSFEVMVVTTSNVALPILVPQKFQSHEGDGASSISTRNTR